MHTHSYQLLDSSSVQIEIPKGGRVRMCAYLLVSLKYTLVMLSPSPRCHFWSFGRSGAGLGLQGWLWSIAFGVPGTGRHCWAGIEALGGLGLQGRAVLGLQGRARLHLPLSSPTHEIFQVNNLLQSVTTGSVGGSIPVLDMGACRGLSLIHI